MTFRTTSRYALVLVAVVVAIFFLRELDGRADAALRGQAAAQQAVEHIDGATVIHLDRGVPDEHLGRGWGDPELGAGVWSVGNDSSVKLIDLPRGGAVDVILTLGPFIAPGSPSQRLRVLAGSRLLSEFMMREPGFRDLRVSVPDDARPRGVPLELQLDLPDAASPAKSIPGSPDQRRIAVMLKTIEMLPPSISSGGIERR